MGRDHTIYSTVPGKVQFAVQPQYYQSPRTGVIHKVSPRTLINVVPDVAAVAATQQQQQQQPTQ
jgi:hypothetical protein